MVNQNLSLVTSVQKTLNIYNFVVHRDTVNAAQQNIFLLKITVTTNTRMHTCRRTLKATPIAHTVLYVAMFHFME